ncbi:MAG TPA: HAD family hydrolase [Polyangiaceae bacterium]|nr:HAD family hydrolase [Polyangiaceae bacterium]
MRGANGGGLSSVLDNPGLRPLFARARCVFFDCDGVVFDSNGFKITAMRRALDGHTPAELDAMEAFWRANGGVSRFVKFEHFYTHIAPRADVAAEMRAASERFGQLARAAYDDAPPITAALDLARAAGAERCHIVSGATEVEMLSVFSSKNIASLFASIQGSPRPKRELVESVLAARGCPPSEALLIGDGSMDFRVCRELDMEFVFLAEYSDWDGARAALAHAPRVSVAQGWDELTRALLG